MNPTNAKKEGRYMVYKRGEREKNNGYCESRGIDVEMLN